MEDIRLEQFKALKEEYRHYLFHIQQLRKFIFITLGVVASAASLNEKVVGNITTDSYAQTIATLGFSLMHHNMSGY